eukprot:10224891-Karenia_brevis.AAC.1
MLRKIVQVRRRRVEQDSDSDSSEASELDEAQQQGAVGQDALEPWINWLRRSTTLSEEMAAKYGVQDWVEEQRIRAWRLAGHTARRTDGRWSAKLLQWTPATGRRAVGHPLKRWGDRLAEFHAHAFHGDANWIQTAQNRELWSTLEKDFAKDF